MSLEFDLLHHTVRDLDIQSALVVGCGTGELVELLAQKHNVPTVGMDISERKITRARQNQLNNTVYVTSDARILAINQCNTDLIVCPITHHLYCQGCDFAEQAILWRRCGCKYVLAEYIDPMDRAIAAMELDYTYNDFLLSFSACKLIVLFSRYHKSSLSRTWFLWQRG